ncbi:hypothetical protein C0Q70_10350 [Pomacea canaliculata]|uniref:KY-like immunoglobulin-like domain-containing protein n=1 Tax=Pomacea canaliculata TaxID=400727 RepID=A0A2T7PCC4_POMCA|nr:uncharacterized protein LOC112563810 [Pomacea canaliculata]PVD31073.1 hypothetical protein C0Q70_10350 [Pomacea canaliculata]
MASRPELPYGYLGPQSKFSEWSLSCISHSNPDIRTDSNQLEIKLRTPKPMKVTSNLIDCANEREYKELVFTQTDGDVVSLLVSLPAAGFFKLQIYALPSTDDSKTLPNVYNYLIQCTSPPPTAVPPYPKQYAQWKEGCYLFEPLHLSNLSNLDTVNFKVKIPGAKAVALTVDTEWFHLQQRDGLWQGTVKGLSRFRGKCNKASLNANYGGDGTKYSSLLEYDL